MQRSTERILTTHTGSLPRPLDLITTLDALDAGTVPDPRIGIPKGIFALAPQEHAPWSTPAPPADRFGHDLCGQPRKEEGVVRKRCGRPAESVVLPEEI